MANEFKVGDIIKFVHSEPGYCDYCGTVRKVFSTESPVVGIGWDRYNNHDPTARVDNYKHVIRHATEKEIKQRLVEILTGKIKHAG
jgi:hypothetical protein